MRTHIVVPRELVERIDAAVGNRGRSRFLVDAAERELRRLDQIQALDAAAGSWRRDDHPELRRGTGRWVKKARREGDRRLAPAASPRRP
jgi:hypothetical protein